MNKRGLNSFKTKGQARDDALVGGGTVALFERSRLEALAQHRVFDAELGERRVKVDVLQQLLFQNFLHLRDRVIVDFDIAILFGSRFAVIDLSRF